MRFLRLSVEGYGRFKERHTFEFNPAFTCILGANESGKSTLLAALLDALYTVPTTTAQAARERIHWGHPHGWTVEVELELHGQRLRVRKFHPVDEPRRRAEFWLETDSETLQGEAARARWEQLWRVPQEVYLATACVRQRELSHLSPRSLRALQQQLRESAVNADLNRILNALSTEQRRLRIHADQHQRTLNALDQRLQQARTHAFRQRELQTRLQQIRAESETLRHQLEHDEALLERWQTLRHYEEQLERLQRQADANQRHLNQLEQLERRANDLESELQTEFADLEALPADFKERLDAAYAQFQQLQQRAAALTAEARRHQQLRQQAIGRNKARVGFAVMGAALLLAGAVLIQTMPLLGAVAIGLGIVAVGVAALWRGGTLQTYSESALTDAYDALRQRWDQLTALLQQAGYTVESMPRNGAPAQVSAHTLQQLEHAVQQFNRRWRAWRERCAELERLRHQIEALQAVHEPKALRDQQRALALEILGLQEKLQREATLREALSAEAALRLETEVARRRERLNQLEAERLRCEGALQTLPDTEPVDALELEYARAERQLQQTQARLRLLQTTEQLLREANARYLSHLSPRLQPRIEHYLPSLTHGRYTRATLDEQLSLQVLHPERGDWLAVEISHPAWSTSVVDQLFFACRLGLADALADDLRLPLLLDDPFVHFDSERYRAALELLRAVAQHTQVLLFSCRPLPPDFAPDAVLRLA